MEQEVSIDKKSIIMRIPIKPIEATTTDDCSTSCLLTVLRYYGLHLERQSVHEAMLQSSRGGPLLTEVARFARNEGFSVDCFGYNLHFTDPKDRELANQYLLGKLAAQQGRTKDSWDLEMIESIMTSIKSGVRYIIEKPNLDTIESFLRSGIPLIVSVSYCAWRNIQGDPYEAHSIVLTGVNRDSFYFIDPDGAQQGQIAIDDFVFAMLSRKLTDAVAYIVAIKPA